MPEFILNTPPRRKPPHPFYDLDTFARGYVEAMFFTNGDTGDEREDLSNDLGVSRLTKASVETIRRDCDAFVNRCKSVGVPFDAFTIDQLEQAGRDFWFTRQGHGVGFWSRGDNAYETEDANGIELRERMDAHARNSGECYVECHRGWIHVR